MRRRIARSFLPLSVALFAALSQAAPSSRPDQATPPTVYEAAPPVAAPPGHLAAGERVTAMLRLSEPALAQAAEGHSYAERAALIDAEQNKLIGQLTQSSAQVLFRTRLAYNGVAVSVPVEQVRTLQYLDGVADVRVIPPKQLVAADTAAVAERTAALVAPGGVTGLGVRIGVIDTGIDYTHADFGGSGASSEYRNNDRAVVEPGTFPTPKVPGGFDFAGDDYDANGVFGSPTPQPDLDPLDCNGRGTHIAGTAAGTGVTSAGETYEGRYTATTDYSRFRVPPGVAPQASLFALKVFGCRAEATTTLTTQALDWALDPNGDGNPSDRLDVVILALGAPFGSDEDPDAVAINNAVQAGLIVVAAAGDGGNTFYAVNSPASAQHAITVGASIGTRPPPPDPSRDLSDRGCNNNNDLQAVFVTNSQTRITNISSSCAYQVGIASYLKFDEVIDNQELFDSATTIVLPGQTVLLEIALPDCATQVDVFRGPVLPSLFGQRYGSRKLGALQLGAPDYCPFAAAPVFGLVEATPRGPQRGNQALKPDLVAPSLAIVSAAVGSGDRGVSRSEVWTGAPQVAGAVAVLRQLHQTWTPTQVKAALMNTAAPVQIDNAQAFPPSLAGAGQLNLTHITSLNLLAHTTAAEDDVALMFGAPWVERPWTATQTLRLENVGSAPRQVTLSQTTVASEAGVSLVLPSSTLVIEPASFVDVPVTISVNPNALDYTADAATPLTQAGFARHYLAEHAGYIQVTSRTVLTTTLAAASLEGVELASDTAEAAARLTTRPGPQTPSNFVLRVPFQIFPKSAADARAQSSLLIAPPGSRSFSLGLQNIGARSSSEITYTLNAQVPLVSALELAATSPPVVDLPERFKPADVRFLGVTSDFSVTNEISNTVLFFGLATEAPWSTPNEVQFLIYIDTNLDGRDDYVVINISRPQSPARPFSDAFVAPVYKILPDGSLQDALGFSLWNTLPPITVAPFLDGAPYNTSVLVEAVGVRFLDIAPGQTRIQYRLESRARDGALFSQTLDRVPAVGWLEYDIARPAIAPLNPRGAIGRRPLFFDTNDSTITGSIDPDILAMLGSQRLLLLHHHNAPAKQAELVEIRSSSTVLIVPQYDNFMYAPLINFQR